MKVTAQTKHDATAKIIKIVAQHLEKKEGDVEPASLLKNLGADEFDMIEIVMKVEDEFGIVIEDGSVDSLTSVDSFSSFVSENKK